MKSTLPQSIQESFRNFIGLSYNDYDCYEIIQYYYKKVLNKDLDSLYTARPSANQTALMVEDQKSRFVEVDKPEFGDIIVFKVFGIPSHVGMYVDNKLFFHSRKGTNATLEKLSIWKNRVVGYYRWP